MRSARIPILSTPVPVISGSIFPYGAVGEAFNGFTPSLDKGLPGGVWSGVNVPSGLSVDAATGALSGTPDAAATKAFAEQYKKGRKSNTLSQSIEITPANICTDPSDLTGTWWFATTNVTTGTADTFRGVTGTKLTETTATGKRVAYHYDAGYSWASGGSYGMAAIVKAAGWSSDRLFKLAAYNGSYSSSAFALFDLGAGATGTTGNTGTWSLTSSEIVDLGGGWYFCRMIFGVGATDLTGAELDWQVTDASETESYAGNTSKILHVAWVDFYQAA